MKNLTYKKQKIRIKDKKRKKRGQKPQNKKNKKQKKKTSNCRKSMNNTVNYNERGSNIYHVTKHTRNVADGAHSLLLLTEQGRRLVFCNYLANRKNNKTNL